MGLSYCVRTRQAVRFPYSFLTVLVTHVIDKPFVGHGLAFRLKLCSPLMHEGCGSKVDCITPVDQSTRNMAARLVRAVVALAMVGTTVAQTGHGCGEAFIDNFADCTPLLHMCFNNSVGFPPVTFPRACACTVFMHVHALKYVIDGRMFDAYLQACVDDC